MELNIFGDFTEGPWKTDAEILKASKIPYEWSPGKDELRHFAASGGRGFVEGAANVWNVLCSIVRHKPRRVNIFTHGADDGYIGLKGWVVKGNVTFDTRKEEYALTPELISEAEEEGFSFSDLKTKNATVNNVRDALGEHAEMVLYACHSGSDQDYLNQIARLLRIKVWGFSKEILYRPLPSRDGLKIVGWRYKVDGDSEEVAHFYKLQPDIVGRPF